LTGLGRCGKRFSSWWIGGPEIHRLCGSNGLPSRLKGVHGETFAQTGLTAFCERFDPFLALLAESQKLDLKASNSLRFAHYRGPLTAAEWVPQTAQNDRLKALGKGLMAVARVLSRCRVFL
jgi:hypothetical protein